MANEKLSKLLDFLKENPDDSSIKFAIAMEHIKSGNESGALQIFNNIVSDDPDYVGVYYHLGKLHENMGEENLAIATYETGIQIAQKVNDAHSLAELNQALSELLYELDDF